MLDIFTKKTGFVFSGAGARIAQECALSEVLIKGLTPSGEKIVPDVMSGSSAGAINIVAINAILDPGVEFGWEEYKNEVLFPLKNKDVYTFTPFAPFLGDSVFETNPLRKLFKDIVEERIGYKTLGDLYLPTYISVVRRSSGRNLRLSAKSKKHSSYTLVDVLMATSAFPVVFPTQRIRGLSGRFFDGGTGRDDLPVEAFAKEKCRRIYIISKMRSKRRAKRETGITPSLKEFVKEKMRFELSENALLAIDFLMDDLFVCELDRAIELASDKAFLYIPKLSKDYPILDFSTQEKQYAETIAWAKKTDPLHLTPVTVKRRRFLA
ncbi:hypothetical protein GF359_04555 [candidate division WOR-3 bacterium]|uniref:PNPLA domain-containing protein n=1 Tax=candidate division WOR-3 bacterium TaxID=2052148 RepID=A0A9D5QCX9_UNCW3|nr:hypothetical protein [candidate division WOR-3 bacterium]MBD3364466.1 hypothetical protein [candidate division WOR-3 bacterium]